LEKWFTSLLSVQIRDDTEDQRFHVATFCEVFGAGHNVIGTGCISFEVCRDTTIAIGKNEDAATCLSWQAHREVADDVEVFELHGNRSLWSSSTGAFTCNVTAGEGVHEQISCRTGMIWKNAEI
jgi:hypothetical protein